MKDRSELCSISKGFFAEIQNQFGVSMRTSRSDNALEYLSSHFQDLFLTTELFTKHLVHTLNKMVPQK